MALLKPRGCFRHLPAGFDQSVNILAENGSPNTRSIWSRETVCRTTQGLCVISHNSGSADATLRR